MDTLAAALGAHGIGLLAEPEPRVLEVKNEQALSLLGLKDSDVGARLELTELADRFEDPDELLAWVEGRRRDPSGGPDPRRYRTRTGRVAELEITPAHTDAAGRWTVKDVTEAETSALPREPFSPVDLVESIAIDVGVRAWEKGLTLVPLDLYFRRGKAKVTLALARGKKLHDKRETLRRKATNREIERELKKAR